MATDLSKIYQTIKDNIRYDYSVGQPTQAGLFALEKFCARHKELGAPYKQWRGAYQMLKDMANVDRIHAMTTEELKILISFADPENMKGRKGVTDSMAYSFLADFHRAYAPLLQEIICYDALQDASKKFTDMWRISVDDLVKMLEKDRYANYNDFVGEVNALAVEHGFHHAVTSGMKKGTHFTADTNRMAEALQGRGYSAYALTNFKTKIMQMMNTASQFSRNDELKLIRIKDEVIAKVQPAFDQYQKAIKDLETIRNLQVVVSQGRQWL